MARYIDANELQKKLTQIADELDYLHEGESWDIGVCLAGTQVDLMPTADVEEVKHGEWKPTNIPAYFGGVIYECSLCGAKDGDHTQILGKYCWRCGAKMDGGKL